MVRRFQLMEPEREPRGGVARAVGRLREGLLRDNKVIPPVLGALALIIFAWIIAGALIGNPTDEDGRQRQQVADQANQPSRQAVQNPDEGIEDGGSDTLDPSVENRDTDSFAAYESKDPFRDLFSPPDETGDGTGGDEGTGDDGASDTTGDDQYGTDDGGGNGNGDGSGNGNGGEDFIDQTFPGGQGGGANGSGGGGTGGGGGGDDLFDSGGDLSP